MITINDKINDEKKTPINFSSPFEEKKTTKFQLIDLLANRQRKKKTVQRSVLNIFFLAHTHTDL